MPITINGSGTITGLGVDGLPAGSVNTATLATSAVTQAKVGSNVTTTGPAFSAYVNANQSYTGGNYTKLQFSLEQFDTANCFDSTTNYRFTPNVAGYYFLNATAELSSTGNRSTLYLYKNGSVFLTGQDSIGNGVNAQGCSFSGLVYANGSTDYFEIYYQGNNNATLYGIAAGAGIVTFFQGYLARAA